jgi:hypothetical protein
MRHHDTFEERSKISEEKRMRSFLLVEAKFRNYKLIKSNLGIYFGLKSAPHSGQNFELTGIRAWHFGQISTTGLCIGLQAGIKDTTTPYIINRDMSDSI